jgi:hypothetical protein
LKVEPTYTPFNNILEIVLYDMVKVYTLDGKELFVVIHSKDFDFLYGNIYGPKYKWECVEFKYDKVFKIIN